jgi:hypothetical protein
MFKIYKSYIKLKIISFLQDKVIECQRLQYEYAARQQKWEQIKYSGTSCPPAGYCSMTEARFNKEKEEQIKFSHDQWVQQYNRHKTLIEICDFVKSV